MRVFIRAPPISLENNVGNDTVLVTSSVVPASTANWEALPNAIVATRPFKVVGDTLG